MVEVSAQLTPHETVCRDHLFAMDGATDLEFASKLYADGHGNPDVEGWKAVRESLVAKGAVIMVGDKAVAK